MTQINKTCTRCNASLPIGSFARRRDNKGDGFVSVCISCRAAVDSAKRKRKYQSRMARGVEQPKRKKQSVRKRPQRYGLTREQLRLMAEAQGNCCAICGCQQTNKALHIDHDHATGQVRKLLCNNCNLGIGFLQDSPRILVNAAKYLMAHGKK